MTTLTDSGLGILCGVKLNNPSTTRTTVQLVLDFGPLHFSNRCEELNEIFIAR